MSLFVAKIKLRDDFDYFFMVRGTKSMKYEKKKSVHDRVLFMVPKITLRSRQEILSKDENLDNLGSDS